MEQIAENIYIETGYLGVTLGGIVEPGMVTYVDAPLLPENFRTWRNGVTGKKKLPARVILLDSHYDRTIGSRYLECPIITQEEVHHVYRNRPITFKPISEHSGSDWETITNMAGFRWIYPEIVFSEVMDIRSIAFTFQLRHAPGASLGSSWLLVPERKVMFIGDMVVKNQVPFLRHADISQWLTSLDRLSGYSDWKIVCGRGGEIDQGDLDAMKSFLVKVNEVIGDYASSHENPDRISSLIPGIKIDRYFQIKKENKPAAVERLTFGLTEYFKHRYMKIEEPVYEPEESEESED